MVTIHDFNYIVTKNTPIQNCTLQIDGLDSTNYNEGDINITLPKGITYEKYAYIPTIERWKDNYSVPFTMGDRIGWYEFLDEFTNGDAEDEFCEDLIKEMNNLSEKEFKNAIIAIHTYSIGPSLLIPKCDITIDVKMLVEIASKRLKDRHEEMYKQGIFPFPQN